MFRYVCPTDINDIIIIIIIITLFYYLKNYLLPKYQFNYNKIITSYFHVSTILTHSLPAI